MEDITLENDVKTRLVLAGLKELEEHGIADFSLRRVASFAEVSCAAPYRHFKDKEHLILAIISHVREGWTLLAEEIGSICENERDRVLRISDAALRFWIANINFRSVLVTGASVFDEERRAQLMLFDAPLKEAVECYATVSGCDASGLQFLVLALVHGSVTLAAEGVYSIDEAALSLRAALNSKMKAY